LGNHVTKSQRITETVDKTYKLT